MCHLLAGHTHLKSLEMSRMGVALGQAKDAEVSSWMLKAVPLGGHRTLSCCEKCLQSAGREPGPTEVQDILLREWKLHNIPERAADSRSMLQTAGAMQLVARSLTLALTMVNPAWRSRPCPVHSYYCGGVSLCKTM